MASYFDVNPTKLIEEVAVELEKIKEIKPPEWAIYVKTGVNRERPPVNDKWWFVRAAAVLRSVAKLGPIGVSKLTKKYGGKKNRGHMPEHTFNGSGNIIRKVLQQLESASLIMKAAKGVHKGRVATPKGLSLLDKTAVKIIKATKKTVHKQHEPEPKPVAENKAEVKAEKKPQKKAEPKEQPAVEVAVESK